MEIKNEQGQIVLPAEQFDPINPIQGAIFNTEEYNRLKEAGVDPSKKDVEPGKPAPDPIVPIEDVIKEKTGGKYSDIDSMIKAIESGAQPQFKDDVSKNIYETLAQGNTEEVYSFLQKKKFSENLPTMKDDDVLASAIAMQNPEYTQEDIDDELSAMKSEFGLDLDQASMSDADYKKALSRGERKLAAEAKRVRTEMSKIFQDISLPEIKKADAPAPKAQEEIEYMELLSAISGSSDKDITGLDKISTSVKNKEVDFSHDFLITDKERAEAITDAKAHIKSLKNSYTKEGKLDLQQVVKERYIIKNFDKIIASAVSKAISETKINIIKGSPDAAILAGGGGSSLSAQDARQALLKDVLFR